MRAVLEAHVSRRDVEPALALLTGSVLVLVTFEGRPASTVVLDGLIDRVLGSTAAARRRRLDAEAHERLEMVPIDALPVAGLDGYLANIDESAFQCWVVRC
jgi:hypothetical protein